MLRSLTSQLPTARTSFVRLHSTGSKPRTTRFLNDFMTEAEKGPLQLSMESKLTEALNPTAFEAINESHLHSHHAAMKGVTEKETHFRVTVVSEEFAGKSMMQRHRMIYKLLGEEFGQGLHALSLKTKTMAELEKSK